MNQKHLRKLIEASKRARSKAYCPYSRYPVGAAVLTDTGRVYAGANVENASYGLSLCAERVAIFNAVTRGEKGLRAVCVVGRSPRPCGACRQVMQEFSSKETELVCVDVGTHTRRETVTRTPMAKVLPTPFDPLEAGLLPPNPQNLLRRKRARDRARKHAAARSRAKRTEKGRKARTAKHRAPRRPAKRRGSR